MTEETDIPRLDYSKSPPGFDPFYLPSNLRGTVVTAGVWGPNAVAAAWAYCRVHYDPLGTIRCGPLGLYVTFGPGLPQFLSRAAAWTWHDRRHALVARLEGEGVQVDMWPHALVWTDAECAECERWPGMRAMPDDFPAVLRSLAEMPEVLRG